MAEEVKQEVIVEEPKVEAPKEEDLISRVSKVKTEPKPKQEVDDKFNTNDLESAIEKIPDPTLKEQIIGLKKSLLKGENQKYQEIATLRKQYEQKLAEVTSWTPDRLKQELNKPDFVQAANEVLKSSAPQGSGISNEQWSSLSDAEKAEFSQLKEKINTLEKTNWEAVKMQQDSQLRSKYADYDPNVVDDTINQLMQGKIKPTREDIWKIISHDSNVKRAYELGSSDKVNLDKERVSGMTISNGNNMPSPTGVERQKGETTQQFMMRSYQEHSKKK